MKNLINSETEMVKKENILCALKIYSERLQELKKHIFYGNTKTLKDESQRLDIVINMNNIQDEVNSIHKCLRILDSLLKRI